MSHSSWSHYNVSFFEVCDSSTFTSLRQIKNMFCGDMLETLPSLNLIHLICIICSCLPFRSDSFILNVMASVSALWDY